RRATAPSRKTSSAGGWRSSPGASGPPTFPVRVSRSHTGETTEGGPLMIGPCWHALLVLAGLLVAGDGQGRLEESAALKGAGAARGAGGAGGGGGGGGGGAGASRGRGAASGGGGAGAEATRAGTRTRLGDLHEESDDLAPARAAREKALALARKAHGDKHW